jgi:flagellar motor switch protein FliN/FliY
MGGITGGSLGIGKPVTNTTGSASASEHDVTFLNDVEVTITVELGRAAMSVRDVLKLRRGSIVELDKLTGQPVELLVNNTPMAKGEVIVVNGRFGFRITKFVAPEES